MPQSQICRFVKFGASSNYGGNYYLMVKRMMSSVRLLILWIILVDASLVTGQIDTSSGKHTEIEIQKIQSDSLKPVLKKNPLMDSSIVFVKILDRKNDSISTYMTVLIAFISAILGYYVKLLISQRNLSLQIRLAAIEKRLDAHQRAFALCGKLFSSLNKKDKLDEVIRECGDFWNDSSLYLGKRSRNLFYRAFTDAEWFYEPSNRPEKDRANKERIFRQISQAQLEIEKEAGLPPITERKNKQA
jgi:hypothetical protein